MVEAKERKRTFSVMAPDSVYERIDRLQRHPRFRSLTQVVLEALRRALPAMEEEYPVGEEEPST